MFSWLGAGSMAISMSGSSVGSMDSLDGVGLKVEVF